MLMLLFLAFLTVVFPVLFCISLARALRLPREDLAAFIAYAAGLALGAAAWLLDVMFRIAPGFPGGLYIGVLALVAFATLIVSVYGLKTYYHTSAAAVLWAPFRGLLVQLTLLERILLGLIAALVLLFAVANLSQPLIFHDPIVHTVVAQLLYRDLSAALYPFAAADPATGFFIEGVHPLGFSLSKVIVMLFAGDAATPWHKPLTAAYFAYLLLAVGAYAVRGFGPRYLVPALLPIVLTPLLLESTLIAHIDPLKVYGFFLPFAFLMEYLRSERRAWLIAGALGCALALHVHAGNVVVVAYLVPIYFLLSRERLWVKIRNMASVGLVAAILAGAQYINNVMIYGSPAFTNSVATDLPQLRQSEFLELQRGVMTLEGILRNGVLAPFFDFGRFGHFYWLSLAGAVVAVLGRRWRAPETAIPLLAIAIYFVLQAAAAAAGVVEFNQNTRYMLVSLPFAAILSAMFLVYLTNQIEAAVHRQRMQPWAREGATAAVLALLIFAPSWDSSYYFYKTKLPSFIAAFPPLTATDQAKVEEARDRGEWLFLTALRLNNLTADQGRIVAFRDAEIYYYSKAYAISAYDRRLVPFYTAKSLKEAQAILRQLNVQYLYLGPSSYSEPEIVNSFFGRIIADARLSELVFESGGYALFRYYPNGRAVTTKEIATYQPPLDASVSYVQPLWYPEGLRRCSTYWTVLAGCERLYDDENWFLLKARKREHSLTNLITGGHEAVIRLDPAACLTYQLGSIQCGKDYVAKFDVLSNSWTVTGEPTGDAGPSTVTYNNAPPYPGLLSLWGALFSFDDEGDLFYSDYSKEERVGSVRLKEPTYQGEMGELKSPKGKEPYDEMRLVVHVAGPGCLGIQVIQRPTLGATYTAFLTLREHDTTYFYFRPAKVANAVAVEFRKVCDDTLRVESFSFEAVVPSHDWTATCSGTQPGPEQSDASFERSAAEACLR